MKNNKAYSDTLSPDLADTVRRILPPENCTGFVTAWTGNPTEKTGAELPALGRLHAWRSPEGDRWNIDRQTALFAGGDHKPVIEISPQPAQGLCFFDALHLCHEYEKIDRETLNRIVFKRADLNTGEMHYRAVAEAANQTFDEITGDLCPVARGRILVGGAFSVEAVQAARKTAAIAIASPDTDLFKVFQDPLNNTTLALAKHDALGKVAKTEPEIARNSFINAIRGGHALLKTMDRYIQSNFDHYTPQNSRDSGYAAASKICGPAMAAFGTTAAAIGATSPWFTAAFSLGIASGVVAVPCGLVILGQQLRKNRDNFFRKGSVGSVYRRAHADFVAAVNAIPDAFVEEKKLCAEFAKAADFAFYMEYAATMAERFSGHKNRDEKLRGYMWLVERATASARMTPQQSQALKESYMNGYLKKGDFYNSCHQFWHDHEWVPVRVQVENHLVNDFDSYGYFEVNEGGRKHTTFRLKEQYTGVQGKLLHTLDRYKI